MLSGTPLMDLPWQDPDLIGTVPALVAEADPVAASAALALDADGAGGPALTVAALPSRYGKPSPAARLSATLPVTTAHYMLHEHWGGRVHDADKTESNHEDDDMCWAAAASNVLAWTGWGRADGMTTSDEMFEHFQDHWTDDGYRTEFGWRWWFDGTELWPGYLASTVDAVDGGAFHPTRTFDDYYRYEQRGNRAMSAIDEYMRAGYGVALDLSGPCGHAITCWGFSYDAADPTQYKGVWITDSDDEIYGEGPFENARYYEVEYEEIREGYGEWYLQDYGYMGIPYCIIQVHALAPSPTRGLSDATVGGVWQAVPGGSSGGSKSAGSSRSDTGLDKAALAGLYQADVYARMHKAKAGKSAFGRDASRHAMMKAPRLVRGLGGEADESAELGSVGSSIEVSLSSSDGMQTDAVWGDDHPVARRQLGMGPLDRVSDRLPGATVDHVAFASLDTRFDSHLDAIRPSLVSATGADADALGALLGGLTRYAPQDTMQAAALGAEQADDADTLDWLFAQGWRPSVLAPWLYHPLVLLS